MIAEPILDAFDDLRLTLRANMLKSDATIEELRAILRYMENGQ